MPLRELGAIETATDDIAIAASNGASHAERNPMVSPIALICFVIDIISPIFNNGWMRVLEIMRRIALRFVDKRLRNMDEIGFFHAQVAYACVESW